MSGMGKPWAVHFTLCMPITCKDAHRQHMVMLKKAARINATSTDLAVGNKLCCRLCSTMFFCCVIFRFWCRRAALLPFNFRYFLRTLLLGRRMNSLGGSKRWYLFQSTCLQTRQYALEWLYFGLGGFMFVSGPQDDLSPPESVKRWVVTSLVRQSYIWLQYLPGSVWHPATNLL